MGCALSALRGYSPSGSAGSFESAFGQFDECAMKGSSKPGLLAPWGLWGSYVSDSPRNIVFKLSNIIGSTGLGGAFVADCRVENPPPIVVLLKVKRPSGDL